MPYLLVGDLNSFIYAENLDEIIRSDNMLIYEAFESAIADAKGYLKRFDLLKIFGDDDTDPVYVNAGLKNKVKALAAWQLVTLGQANIKIDLARTMYEDAIRWFEKVSRREINPDLPMPEDDVNTGTNESGSIDWNSLPKRNNHF